MKKVLRMTSKLPILIVVILAAAFMVYGCTGSAGATDPAGSNTGMIEIGSIPFISNYGTDNTFVGENAGNFITTGTGVNTFIGYNAGMANTTGYWNTFIGYAGVANTTGYRNTFVGVGAGRQNTTGYENVFVGHVAGQSNATGNDNTAVGEYTMTYNSTADNNTALGRYALHSNQTGPDNTAVGWGAGHGDSGPDTGGSSFTGNTLVGRAAGYNLSTGSYNVLIGRNAGYDLMTGGYNIIIGGYITEAPAPTTSYFLNIGNTIYGNLFTGNVGIGTTAPTSKLDVNGGIKLSTTTSKPACDSTTRGTLWFSQGTSGIKDALEVCAKDATDTYAWRVLY